MSDETERPGILTFETFRKDRRRMLTVAGADPDAVWATALEARNRWGVELATESSGLQQSPVPPGWHFVIIVERERCAVGKRHEPAH